MPELFPVVHEGRVQAVPVRQSYEGLGAVVEVLAQHLVFSASKYPNIEDHEDVIRNGIQPGMPAWGEKLSDDDIQAVARWEREGF